MKGPLVGLSLCFFVTACRPHFEERESLVTGPRILAVRVDPPESSPGDAATYEALVVSREGTQTDITAHWSFCAAPKPLTENSSVSAECLGNAVRPLESTSLAIMASTPNDACSLFGPETPPGNFRPTDPDETGGFYQPIRISALGQVAFAFERITCNLPNAPLEAATELGQRYVLNQNPALTPLQATVAVTPASLDGIAAGRNVQFEIGWGADDAEPFVAFDPATQSIVERREAMRVFWYATAGEFAADVTGKAANEFNTTVSNGWQAPEEAGQIFLWVVLRDERGGLDWAGYTINVLPP